MHRNVASIFINLMLQGRQPIIYGDGEQKRCFSFVSDAVAPLKAMATSDACNGQIINIGPDDELVTINELARVIAKLLSFPLAIEYARARAQEVYVASCSADKARKLLSYEPRVRLEDGLREMIDDIRRRGPRPFKYHLDLEIVNDRVPDTWSQRLL